MEGKSYRIIKGRGVFPGIVEAEALVTTESISLLGGVNQETSEVIELNHPLSGEYISGKVLMYILPITASSLATNFMTMEVLLTIVA